MGSFFEICVKRPVMTIMMSLALMVFGAISLLRLPVRELPDADPVVAEAAEWALAELTPFP